MVASRCIRLIIVSVIAMSLMINASAASYELQEQRLKFVSLDMCVERVRGQVRLERDDLDTFDSIGELARWTLIHLPEKITDGFRRAGMTVGQEFSIVDFDKEADVHFIYSAIVSELPLYVECEEFGESLVAEVLRQELYLSLDLGRGAIAHQFENALSMKDSYEVERAFMAILALETASVPWKGK